MITFRSSFVSAGRQNVRGKNPNWMVEFFMFSDKSSISHLNFAMFEHQSVIVLPQPVLPPNVESPWSEDAWCQINQV